MRDDISERLLTVWQKGRSRKDKEHRMASARNRDIERRMAVAVIQLLMMAAGCFMAGKLSERL